MAAETDRPEPQQAAEEALLSLAANETCRLVRRCADDGADELHGIFRVRFDIGDNRASLFVPFAPGFDFDPAIEYEQVDGPDADIKLAGCFPHGLRLDLKVDQPRRSEDESGDGDVLVELFARADSLDG